MSKLRSVIRHEYLTIIKQPSFWAMMITIPLIIGVIVGLNYFSSKTSTDKIEELASELQSVSIIDNSGLINSEVVTQSGLKIHDDSEKDQLVETVRDGKAPAVIVYPSDLTTSRTYKVYIDGNDIATLGAVSTMAENILKTSLFLPIGSAEVIALAQTGVSSDITFFQDGRETAGFNEYLAPGLFVVLFYIIFAFSVGYMLTSISEEKENRSMEMILTYVKPRTLIVGKLLGVSLVTLTQIAFFGLMALVAWLVSQQMGGMSLPFGLDISKAVIHPLTIMLSFGYLVAGFLMYAGFMTTVAAIAPSAKEANNFSSVFFIGAFIPFYFVMMIVTDPTSPVVTFMSYFPLTSPVVALMRNTTGSLGAIEGWAVLAVMSTFMVASIWVAIRAFKLGALEFSQTIKLSKLFK